MACLGSRTALGPVPGLRITRCARLARPDAHLPDPLRSAQRALVPRQSAAGVPPLWPGPRPVRTWLAPARRLLDLARRAATVLSSARAPGCLLRRSGRESNRRPSDRPARPLRADDQAEARQLHPDRAAVLRPRHRL